MMMSKARASFTAALLFAVPGFLACSGDPPIVATAPDFATMTAGDMASPPVILDLTVGPDLAPLCRRAADCGGGGGGTKACCNGGCVDPSNDPKNCGGCNVVCNAGANCCNGNCADLTKDPGNCGACGTSCAFPMSGAACTNSACTRGACQPYWGDCNNNPADGCETSLRAKDNCTKCGNVCKINNAISGCSDTGCYLSACLFGWDDCNQDETDGCEVSVLSDVKNCGACGHLCTAPNSKQGCTTATCVITSCSYNYYDCDNNAANGCETLGLSDAKNCGGCGIACAQGLVCKAGLCTCPNCNIPNASSKCANNVCTLDKCNPGFSDCDNNVANGCESLTASDAKNCGGCNVVCPKNLPVCVNSACTDSTHSLMALAPDYNAASGCGDSSSWWSQNFGQMTWQDCEAMANKYGAMYMGQTGYFAGGNYAQCPYSGFTRWVGEADANNGYVGTNNWSIVTSTAKGNMNYCVLAYANANAPGNDTYADTIVSLNGQTYLYKDFGNISENTCYTNARQAGARPLNPWMLQGLANPARAHMSENHTCHGSTQYTGLNAYTNDGQANHTYRCVLGYTQ